MCRQDYRLETYYWYDSFRYELWHRNELKIECEVELETPYVNICPDSIEPDSY